MFVDPHHKVTNPLISVVSFRYFTIDISENAVPESTMCRSWCNLPLILKYVKSALISDLNASFASVKDNAFVGFVNPVRAHVVHSDDTCKIS